MTSGNRVAPQSSLYLFIALKENGIVVKGESVCSLGHEIPRAGSDIPDGVFAKWKWDGQRLTIENDRYGFFPLYYYLGTDCIALSPSIATLLSLGAPSNFDYVGLGLFLRLGFFIGDRTPFQSVQALPPGSRFEWCSGKLKRLSKFPSIVEMPMSRKQAIEAYTTLFQDAIGRRLPSEGESILMLSGGRDSRHILLELVRAEHSPSLCVTVPDGPRETNEDVKVAAQLTKTLGLKHVVLEPQKSRLEGEKEMHLRTNFCSDEGAWFMPVVNYLSRMRGTLYDGIGGDVLSAGLFLTRERLDLFTSGRLRELAESLLPTDFDSILRTMFKEATFPCSDRESALDELEAELARFSAFPNPVGAFFFFNRTRREIALGSYCMLADVGTSYSPFLDHDVYNHLASLPASMFLDHQFHTETIKTAFPQYADIPFANSANDPPKGARIHQRFAWELLRYSLRRMPLPYVEGRFVYPRLFRCVADSNYSKSVEWFGPMVVYFIQLDDLIKTNDKRLQ